MTMTNSKRCLLIILFNKTQDANQKITNLLKTMKQSLNDAQHNDSNNNYSIYSNDDFTT